MFCVFELCFLTTLLVPRWNLWSVCPFYSGLLFDHFNYIAAQRIVPERGGGGGMEKGVKPTQWSGVAVYEVKLPPKHHVVWPNTHGPQALATALSVHGCQVCM